MIQLTYGQAKGPIAAVCGDTGMPVTDARVLGYVNAAVQELMNEGEWPGVVDRYHVVALSGEVTLPSFLDRIMQVNVRGVPQTIASAYYQFVAYGPGTDEDQCGYGRWWCDGAMIEDRGEYPTKVSIPEDGVGGPWVVRVYTQVNEAVDDVVPYCTIQGIGYDGRVVRTQLTDGTNAGEWINGERVALDYTVPYVQTSIQWRSITAFTKPATNGYVRLTAYNGPVEIELSDYEPDETNPSYHRYYSRFLQYLQEPEDSALRVVRGRCRKRFVPVAEDTDELIVSNLPALKEMTIAVWKRESDDYQGYTAHKQTAVDLMRKEAMAYRGKSRIPGLTFQRGFAVGSSLPALR